MFVVQIFQSSSVYKEIVRVATFFARDTFLGTRLATALILRTSTLSDMGALDKRLYTSHPAPTDDVSRLEPDRVNLARNGCMLPSAVRLSLSNCTHQLHPYTILTAAHHIHTHPPDVNACLAYPKSLSHTYSSFELRSSPNV